MWVYSDELLWIAVMLDPRSSIRKKEALFAEAQKRGVANSASLLQHSHIPLQQFSTLASFFLNFVTNTRLPLTLLEEHALNSSQSASSSSSPSSSSSSPSPCSSPSSSSSSSSSQDASRTLHGKCRQLTFSSRF